MLIGKILRGRYEILGRLGEGAFGETYKAKDLEKPSKPFCVVKRLKPAHTNQLVRDFFDKEAAVLEKLGKHPQIPDLLAHFMIDKDLFIVQEFVDGHSLRDEITPGKPLSEGYVTKLLHDVLEILVFVHKNGVIHRDIKPENVMRRRQDGKLVLIDFGVVKELGSVVVNSGGSVQASVVAGTPGYMASEQARGKPGFCSDIYAVGMMAIEALTGVYPGNLPDYPQTGEIQWRDKAKVSDRLATVIEKMVREFYRQRYPSAIEALQALQPIMSPPASAPASIPILDPSIAAPATTPTLAAVSTPSPTLQPRRKFLQTAGWVGTGVAITVLVGRLLESIFDNSPPSTPNPTDRPILPPADAETPIAESPPSPPPITDATLQSFQFETVTVDERGEEIERTNGQARFFAEDLGNGITLEMVEIPGGTFTMGSPADEPERNEDESPQHQVAVPGFFMGRFQVTQAQYEAIMDSNLSTFDGANHPVENVSWNEAIEFCEKLSQRTGRMYRLPSEAEWEYACRAETTTPFHFGETITSVLVNYDTNVTYRSEPAGEYRQQPIDVGSFPPNAFGLHDMHGNVWEWCQDVWHDQYSGAPTDGSAWVTGGDGNRRLQRGGSCFNEPGFCRSAYRSREFPDNRSASVGFRVVLSATTS